MSLRLYTYWRSSSSYRVRIALNLKGLEYEQVPVHLARGEQHGVYRQLNPQGMVPALAHDGMLLIQSLAIIDYLEHAFPQPALLPEDAADRARVIALAQIVVAETQPLNNFGVLKYLAGEVGISEEQRQGWYEHWVARGFAAFEALLADPRSGEFCHGDKPTLADICLVPQVYNARRFNCDLEPYPGIRRIEERCLQLPAFDDAVPERQPDCDQ
ncbi:MAG: maleylacetoacetate isomerase [Gammaproteobacteria bacterium]|nr:maleylacetoacetate isomerase [Gammaproteobacteria bacterium]NNF61605.1 maleylacetoacetate isomerase [Gammaproteobacteria bacterium]